MLTTFIEGVRVCEGEMRAARPIFTHIFTVKHGYLDSSVMSY